MFYCDKRVYNYALKMFGYLGSFPTMCICGGSLKTPKHVM